MAISYQSALIRREHVMRSIEELGLLHDVYRTVEGSEALIGVALDAIVILGGELEVLNPFIIQMEMFMRNESEKSQRERMAALVPINSFEDYADFLAEQDLIG